MAVRNWEVQQWQTVWCKHLPGKQTGTRAGITVKEPSGSAGPEKGQDKKGPKGQKVLENLTALQTEHQPQRSPEGCPQDR